MSDKYYRDTVLEVDLDAITENYHMIQKQNYEKTFIAVVKADSYGLGAEVIANHLVNQGVTFFAVATLDEAIALRMHGIKEKILVLGTINPEHINKAIQHRIAVTAPSLSWVEAAIDMVDEKYEKQVWIHIKVNTGMNRYGTSDIEEIKTMIDKINHYQRFIYEGIYSHFTSSDLEGDMTTEEYDKFKAIVENVQRPSYVHIANSAGALLLEEDLTTAVRSGISLYGYYPSAYVKENTSVKLRPSVRLVSHIAAIHHLNKDESVSYGRTYTAREKETVATLPLGYADGIRRQHRGYEVKLNQQNLPIIGTICMDALIIKVPSNTSVGESVTIIDNSNDSDQSMEKYSEYVETISYESLCSLGKRLVRHYSTKEEKMVLNTVIN